MTKYKFSGHQTFTFRYGWLEKGVQLIKNDPKGFLSEDVLVRLGVGKNMVESIKYWGLQTQLLESTDAVGELKLSSLAIDIFGDDKSVGFDPYLEDDATLWLIHWSLIRNKIWSTWQLVFANLNKPEFTKRELFESISRWIQDKVKVTDSTLTRDIDCFVRTYTNSGKGKINEESFDCPFLNLGLIQQTSESDLYRFNIGAKMSLPFELVGFSILHMMDERKRSSLLVQNCLYEDDSPGQIFKLDEGALMAHLEELESTTKGKLIINDTAGMTSFVFKGTDYIDFAKILLKNYYNKISVTK